MNGRTVKKVDNEEIAQAWLALIGFSEQAVDQRRHLFSSDRNYYDLIFLNRTSRHGKDYKHRIADPKVLQDAATQSPTGEGMLVAYLVREFARNVVRSRKENREEAVSRLDIGNLARNAQEAELSEDEEYITGLVLRGMLFLFVEFFGYTMFSAFGEDVHGVFEKVLRNGSLKVMAESGDLSVAKNHVYKGDYDCDDVLIHLWELYSHCVSQMIASAWFRERMQAPNISKYTYSERTRGPLYRELEEIGKLFKKGRWSREWSLPFNEAGSVESYLRNTLQTS